MIVHKCMSDSTKTCNVVDTSGLGGAGGAVNLGGWALGPCIVHVMCTWYLILKLVATYFDSYVVFLSYVSLDGPMAASQPLATYGKEKDKLNYCPILHHPPMSKSILWDSQVPTCTSICQLYGVKSYIEWSRESYIIW